MFSSLIETYKQELGEFVSVVREDSSRALASAADKIKQFQGDEDDEDDDGGPKDGESEEAELRNESPSPKPVATAFRAASFKDLRSFIDAGSVKRDHAYANFSKSFQLGLQQDQIQRASEDPDTAKLAQELTKDGEMSEHDFWSAYFYFQHAQRRAKLLAGEGAEYEDEEDLSWGDDDDDDDDLSGECRNVEETNQKVADENSKGETSTHTTNASHTTVTASGMDDRERKNFRKDIEALTRKLQQAEIRASLAEENSCVLSSKVSELEQQLDEARDKITNLQSQLKEPTSGDDSPGSWQVEDGSTKPGKDTEQEEEDGDDIDLGWG